MPFVLNAICQHFMMGLAIFMGWKYFSRLSLPFRIFFYYLIFLEISGFVGVWSAYEIRNNLWVNHIRVPVQAVIYTWVFTLLMPEWKKLSRFLWMVTIGVVVVLIINSTYVQSPMQTNRLGSMLLHTLVIAESLSFFHYMLSDPKPEPIEKSPLFWFNISTLSFFCITYFINAYQNVLYEQGVDAPIWFRYLLQFGAMGLYAAYSGAFWLFKNHKREVPLG